MARWKRSERRYSNPDLPPSPSNAFALTDHNHYGTLFEASKVAEVPFTTSGKVVFFYSILTKKLRPSRFPQKQNNLQSKSHLNDHPRKVTAVFFTTKFQFLFYGINLVEIMAVSSEQVNKVGPSLATK